MALYSWNGFCKLFAGFSKSCAAVIINRLFENKWLCLWMCKYLIKLLTSHLESALHFWPKVLHLLSRFPSVIPTKDIKYASRPRYFSRVIGDLIANKNESYGVSNWSSFPLFFHSLLLQNPILRLITSRTCRDSNLHILGSTDWHLAFSEEWKILDPQNWMLNKWLFSLVLN